VVTVVLNTEHTVDYFHDAPGKAHSRARPCASAKWKTPEGDEREETPGADGGYLWRMELVRIAEGDAAFTCRAKCFADAGHSHGDSRG